MIVQRLVPARLSVLAALTIVATACGPAAATVPPTAEPRPPTATPVPPTRTPEPAPIPVQVNLFAPGAELVVGFEEQPVQVGVQLADADDRPVTGAQVETLITLPDGKQCAGTLKETSESVYRGEICSLGQDAPPGTYTVTVTVRGACQGQQRHTFTVYPPQVVEMYGFRVRAPQSYRIAERGKEYAESQGDVSVELSSSGANSVLIYRKTGQVPLEVEAMTRLLSDINTGSYDMETIVENSEPVEFDGKPALFLKGHWTHDVYGKGPFKAVGLQCEGYFYVVEAAINGPWSSDLTHVMDSFHCLEE